MNWDIFLTVTLVSGFLGSFGLWMFMRYVLGKDTTMDMASGIGVVLIILFSATVLLFSVMGLILRWMALTS